MGGPTPTTPKFSITGIPAIMRANHWDTGAALMDSWFGRFVAIAPKYGLPDTTTVTMSWALGFKRAKEVYDQLVKDRIWQNAPAQGEIAAMLRRKGVLVAGMGPTRFGSLGMPAPAADADYINQRKMDVTADLDDMMAALGRFLFNVVVGGTVKAAKPSGYEVSIDEVGIYIKDSYDFQGHQFLGFWNAATNDVSMINPFVGVAVDNGDFRDWRTANGMGGDFRVFSDIVRLSISPPDKFTIP